MFQRYASRALDASAELQSEFLQGSSALWGGDLRAAESFLARALGSGATLEEADRPYGVNAVVSARTNDSLRRWVAGSPDDARPLVSAAGRRGRASRVSRARADRARVVTSRPSRARSGKPTSEVAATTTSGRAGAADGTSEAPAAAVRSRPW